MNSDHLLALGLFAFGMDTIAYQEFTRRASWRHPSAPRYGALPASQYVGPAAREITLQGVLIPEFSGSYSDIDRLHEMADLGEIYPLVTGSGDVLGEYKIIAIDDRWRELIKGGLGRAADFAIDLEEARR